MLRFSVLASGSNGNSIYIETLETKVLLDAGISGKQIRDRLAHVAKVRLDELDALLLTHEHVDHVRGLPQVLKQSKAAVYSSEGTWSAAYEQQHIDEKVQNLAERVSPGREPGNFVTTVHAGEPFVIHDLTITPFAVSHDAEEPLAYRFDAYGKSLTVLTDLGYVSDKIKAVISGCQCYVLETNHDVDMLRAGPYPWSLKRRILGDKGHLSNQDAALALVDVINSADYVDVYLAHLSAENNQQDLAELTVASTVRETSPRYADQVRLRHTSRAQATELHAL